MGFSTKIINSLIAKIKNYGFDSPIVQLFATKKDSWFDEIVFLKV